MKNWKTTLAGIAAIFGVVVKFINDPKDVTVQDIATLSAGIGLLAAKDFDVSHSKP